MQGNLTSAQRSNALSLRDQSRKVCDGDSLKPDCSGILSVFYSIEY